MCNGSNVNVGVVAVAVLCWGGAPAAAMLGHPMSCPGSACAVSCTRCCCCSSLLPFWTMLAIGCQRGLISRGNCFPRITKQVPFPSGWGGGGSIPSPDAYLPRASPKQLVGFIAMARDPFKRL